MPGLTLPTQIPPRAVAVSGVERRLRLLIHPQTSNWRREGLGREPQQAPAGRVLARPSRRGAKVSRGRT